MADFYEPDEPVENLLQTFNAGVKHTTREAEGRSRCPRCVDLGKLGADGRSGDVIADAARAHYEMLHPGQCWYDAPDDQRRAYLHAACAAFMSALTGD